MVKWWKQRLRGAHASLCGIAARVLCVLRHAVCRLRCLAARLPCPPACPPTFVLACPPTSPLQMRELNKGIGVDNLHYLTDGLWNTPTVA